MEEGHVMPGMDDRLKLNLRVALRQDADGDPDAFAGLVAAVLAFRDVGGAYDRRMASHLGVTADDVHRMANGILAPTPRFRREAVRKLRGFAVDLGVEES